MHAVVVRVTISDRESAQNVLRNEVVPGVSQAPGFQAGYWTGKGDSGLSMVIFDSEEAAETVAERARSMVSEGVNLEEVEVREVVAHA